ncbi:hypothetical protein DMH20_08730 [Escherichia coli]|nr:hypothetical protein [Escherichia coli]
MDAHQHTVEMVQTFPANIATVHTNAAPRVMFHCLRQQGQFTRIKIFPVGWSGFEEVKNLSLLS